MSHEISLRTSKVVLTASIVICSTLAIASVVRLVADRVNASRSGNGQMLASTANQDLTRAFSEFHPQLRTNVAASSVSVVSKLAPTSSPAGQAPTEFRTQPTVGTQTQLPAAAKLQTLLVGQSVGKPVTVQASVAPSEAPQVLVPVTVNVDNSDVVTELMRVHERIDELAEQSARHAETHLAMQKSSVPTEAESDAAESIISASLDFPMPAPIVESNPFAIDAETKEPDVADDRFETSDNAESPLKIELTETNHSVPTDAFPSAYERLQETPEFSPERVAVAETHLDQPPVFASEAPTAAVSPSAVVIDLLQDPIEHSVSFEAAEVTPDSADTAFTATFLTGPTVGSTAKSTAVPLADSITTSDEWPSQSRSQIEPGEPSTAVGGEPTNVPFVLNSDDAARNSGRSGNPLTPLRQRISGSKQAPLFLGFKRPEWVDELADWRKRRSEAISSAAHSATIAFKPQSQRSTPATESQPQHVQHPYGKQSLSRPATTGARQQPDNARSSVSHSNPTPVAPEWSGDFGTAASGRPGKSSQILHRVTSAVRFAARTKTVD